MVAGIGNKYHGALTLNTKLVKKEKDYLFIQNWDNNTENSQNKHQILNKHTLNFWKIEFFFYFKIHLSLPTF